jgi:hypothetical protein
LQSNNHTDFIHTELKHYQAEIEKEDCAGLYDITFSNQKGSDAMELPVYTKLHQEQFGETECMQAYNDQNFQRQEW